MLSNSVIDPETKISKNICRKEEKIELNSADGSAVNQSPAWLLAFTSKIKNRCQFEVYVTEEFVFFVFISIFIKIKKYILF